MSFDFMLSNMPYGKSWKTDQKWIKVGKDVVTHGSKSTFLDMMAPSKPVIRPRVHPQGASGAGAGGSERYGRCPDAKVVNASRCIRIEVGCS